MLRHCPELARGQQLIPSPFPSGSCLASLLRGHSAAATLLCPLTSGPEACKACCVPPSGLYSLCVLPALLSCVSPPTFSPTPVFLPPPPPWPSMVRCAEELVALKSLLMPGRPRGLQAAPGRKSTKKASRAPGTRPTARRRRRSRRSAQAPAAGPGAGAGAGDARPPGRGHQQWQAQGQPRGPAAGLKERGRQGQGPRPDPPGPSPSQGRVHPRRTLGCRRAAARGGAGGAPLREMDPEPTLPMAHHMCGPQLSSHKGACAGGMCAPHFPSRLYAGRSSGPGEGEGLEDHHQEGGIAFACREREGACGGNRSQGRPPPLPEHRVCERGRERSGAPRPRPRRRLEPPEQQEGACRRRPRAGKGQGNGLRRGGGQGQAGGAGRAPVHEARPLP